MSTFKTDPRPPCQIQTNTLRHIQMSRSPAWFAYVEGIEWGGYWAVALSVSLSNRGASNVLNPP
jgi:hypothetical protein